MRVLRTWLVALAVALAAVTLSAGTAQAAAPAEPPECQSLEGCYDHAGMQAFYGKVVTLVDEYSTATYTAMPQPAYAYIPSGSTAPTSCGLGDARAFFFCGPDDSVYVGQDQLWDFYSLDGDAAAAFGVAHEWGHHVQHVAGVFGAVDTLEEAIQSENQADCIGGSFLRHLDDQGILEPDDYSDLSSILVKIASAEGPDRDHGTVQERFAATQLGFAQGLAGCNAFFPDTPVLA
jgi:predicted metalloprotease